ncbi:MAG: ATP-binding protein [Pseudonocardia sp.]
MRHPAEPAQLRRIRRQVDDWAQRNALPEDVLIDLQLALGEAVANGVEHAYAGTGAGTVDVELEIRSGAARVVAVRVADYGSWRPVPMASGHRGRGLAVIERLARGVVVSRTRAGTEICFEIPFPA